MNKQNDQIQPLNQESFNAIASAFGRLQQLGDSKIATGAGDTTQQEREQLIAFLATEMMAHISEFLGAYQLCNQEYLPFLRGLKSIAARCGYAPTPAAPYNPVNPERN